MKPEELTRTIALYQHTGSGTLIVSAYYADEKDTQSYVRVSEPLQIEFAARATTEIMAAAVSALDAQIVEAQQAVRSLEQRKAELLALPAPEAAFVVSRAAAVSALDAQIVEAQQAVRSLEQRKAELLALPAPEAV